MTLIRKSTKAAGLVTGLLALGTALAPFASAAIYLCFYLGGGWFACIRVQ
jgi:hypothetical protein